MRSRTAFVFLATLFLVFGTCISFKPFKLTWQLGDDREVTQYLPEHDSIARIGVYTSSETWGTVLTLNNPFPKEAHLSVFGDGKLVDFRRIDHPTKHLVLQPSDRTTRVLEMPRGTAPDKFTVEWTEKAPTAVCAEYEGRLLVPHAI